MMPTARIKTCALAACLLAACLLLPDTQAKAETISLPEPDKASQTQPEAAAEKTESVPVLTTLSYETVVETIEEPAPEAALETPEETPAPEDAQEQAPAAEADNAITRATKADLARPDDLVKLGDFIATAYCVTGQTSTGTQTTVGRTLAVNPHVIPYGTEVWLYLEDGTFAGDFIAEDTGKFQRDRYLHGRRLVPRLHPLGRTGCRGLHPSHRGSRTACAITAIEKLPFACYNDS